MSYREFTPDTFTEADVLRCLDFAGLKHRNMGKYIFSQCPFHDDKHPSAQIFKNDWFVGCNAGCDRQHITKAFPELRDNHNGIVTPRTRRTSMQSKAQEPRKHFDQIEEWKTMPLIPRDHTFKNIPLEVLDSMGWRWSEAKDSYYIPYFSADREHIPFSQMRHFSGVPGDPNRRFTFLYGAEPTMYGKWNLQDATKLFLVEGASDAACLEYAGVPWIAAPSAGSETLVGIFAEYCMKRGIRIVYAGDNDTEENRFAGEKLRKALEGKMPRYRTCQPPEQYKDWCDFLAAESIEAVRAYIDPELGVPQVPSSTDKYVSPSDETLDVEVIFAMFPGAQAVGT